MKKKNGGFCFRFTIGEDIVYNETEDDLTIDNEIRGFSFSNIVDSVFTVMANGLDSIVTSIIGTEKSGKPKPNRVNYKNYQLIRLFPSSQGHVKELKELKEAETEDIKFWSEPMYNKCVSCIFSSSSPILILRIAWIIFIIVYSRTTDVVVAPDLVSELKIFLRDKGIDFKVLITNIQVRDGIGEK